MKKIITVLAIMTAVCSLYAQKTVDIQKTDFIFLDRKDGARVLAGEDEFTRSLSDFDRSARLKTSEKVSTKEYLDFVSRQSLDWTDSEIERFRMIIGRVKESLTGYDIRIPGKMYFIKTTGDEEGNAVYCRGLNAVVLPGKKTADLSDDNLQTLLTHELFHIYSKNNLDKREQLYKIVGFYKTQPLVLPAELEPLNITNPDSVVRNYYFATEIGGEKINVMPVLLATGPYDEKKGGRIFDYLQLVFFAVETKGNSSVLVKKDGQYVSYTMQQIPDFAGKIGKNTKYIIHAEEILAENFKLMAVKQDVPSPEIIEQMQSVLKKK
jgi:hypothetical protein